MERRADAIFRYISQELSAGHSLDDARSRGCLRADIDAAIHRHTMTRAEAHDAIGLAAGSLDDGSLDTEAIRQALDALRAIPGGMADMSFALGRCA